MTHVRAEGSVIHGYPHLAVIRRSITGMYRSLSSGVVSSFGASLTPESIVLPGDSDLIIGVQYLARAIVRHLKLPEARMIVTFRNMNDAGHVELARGPEYFIELHTRYQRDRRDIAAVLAHEVMHVFLHRARCRLPDTHDNEILTDTAATYLGIGWPILNAYRHIK